MTLMGLSSPEDIPDEIREMCSSSELMLLRKNNHQGPTGMFLISIINTCGYKVALDHKPKRYSWWPSTPTTETTQSSSTFSGAQEPVFGGEEKPSKEERKEGAIALAAAEGNLKVASGNGVNWAAVERGTKVFANWHGRRAAVFLKVMGNKGLCRLENGNERKILLEKLDLDEVDG
jgi:hypothetical protein